MKQASNLKASLLQTTPLFEGLAVGFHVGYSSQVAGICHLATVMAILYASCGSSLKSISPVPFQLRSLELHPTQATPQEPTNFCP